MELAELEQVFKALSPKVQNSSFAKDVREEIAARIRVQPGMPAPDFTLKHPMGQIISIRFAREIRDSGFLGFLVSSLQSLLSLK